MAFGANDPVVFGADDEAVPEDEASTPRDAGGKRGSRAREQRVQDAKFTYDPETGARVPIDTFNKRFVGAGAALGSVHPETVLSGITGGIGSLADTLTGSDPGAHDWAYRPRTESGLAAEQAIAEAFAPMLAHTEGEGPLAQTLKERVPQFLGAAGTVVGGAGLLKGAAGLGDAVAAASERRAATAAARIPTPDNVNPGQAAALYGLDVSPVELQHARPTMDVGHVTQFMERAGGPGLGENRALANAPRLNQAAAKAADLGDLPQGSLLTEQVFDRAKAPHEAVYDRGRTIPGQGSSKQYLDEISSLGNERGVSTTAEREIGHLQSTYADAGTSAQIVQDIKTLRRKSSKNIQLGDPDKGDLGYAQRKVADALENELARRAVASGDIAYASDLAGARRALAKIYTVEDATWADHLDLSKLVAAKQRGAPLTGDLAVLADIGERLPRSMRHTLDVGGAPSGAEASAAGPSGLVSRLIQNLTRRFGGQQIVNRFNRGLQGDVAGMSPEELFPQHFQPNYDFNPRMLGENFGPPDQLLPPVSPSLDELLAMDAGSAPGLDIQPGGLSQVASPAVPPGLSLEPPDLNSALAPRTYALDQELMAALGLEPGAGASMSRELGQGPLLGEALDQPPAGIPVPPTGINEAQLGLPSESNAPWLGGGVPPPARPYALDLQELADALGIQEATPQVEFPNNASGQTAVSLEALSALADQPPRYRVNIETGERTPLPGIEARDPKAGSGEIIVEEDPSTPGGFKVVDRGGSPQSHLRGVLERMRSHKE